MPGNDARRCSPLFQEAYTQTLPVSIWGKPSMPVDQATITLPAPARPGDPFVGPLEAALLGVTLADPFGPWPATATSPGLTWVDHDADGKPGVTSLMTAAGRSSACNLNSADLPIPAAGARAHEIYTGSRSLGRLDGTVVSCAVIQGTVTGPNAGMPRLDGHVIGCLRPDGACTTAESESLDSNGSSAAQRVTGARFTMVRVPDSITCAQVSSVTFPPHRPDRHSPRITSGSWVCRLTGSVSRAGPWPGSLHRSLRR